jgi:hypothetical protein
MPAPAYDTAVPEKREDIHPLEAVKYLFQDPDWGHDLLIGSVYMLIPVVGPLCLMGWHCEMMQRLVRGHPKPIPKLELADLTHYLSRGVSPFVVSLVFSLPVSFAISMLVWILMAASVGAAQLGHQDVMVIAIVVGTVVGLVAGFLMSIVIMAGVTRAELTEDAGGSLSPSAAFAYAGKTWWQIFANNLLYTLMSVPLALVGYCACFIGVLPVSVALMAGMVHLRFQIYRHYLYKGGAPIPVKPVVWLPSELARAYPYAYGPR